MSNTLAIIRRPKFGVGDRGTVTLTFDTYVAESSAALQVFNAEDGAKILEEYKAKDVSELEGKPCWVDTSSAGMIRWAKAWRV